jgi:hypothetical protein
MDTAVQPKVVEDPRVFDAQAEVFWLAFQALPRPAQWVVRERLALAGVRLRIGAGVGKLANRRQRGIAVFRGDSK